MKWVIIKGVRYPISVVSAFAAYYGDNPFVMKVIWMGFLGVLVMRNSMFASQYLFMRRHEIFRKDLPCTLLK